MSTQINEDAVDPIDSDAPVADQIAAVDRLENQTPTKARMDAAERAEHADAERRKHHGDPTNGVYSGLDTISMGGH